MLPYGETGSAVQETLDTHIYSTISHKRTAKPCMLLYFFAGSAESAAWPSFSFASMFFHMERGGVAPVDLCIELWATR